MHLARICLLALLLLPLTARAQAPAAASGKTEVDKARAREAFRRGTHSYDFGEYDKALEAFKEAYSAYEDAGFLFNIAQCHRQLGHTEEALRVYRSYLRNAQNPPNADEVRRLIARLEKTLDAEKQNRHVPPEGMVPPESPANAAAPPPSDAPPPATTPSSPPPQPALVVTPAPAHDDRPLVKKPWFWGVMAGAVVVAGAVIAVGVVEGTKSPANPKASITTVDGN